MRKINVPYIDQSVRYPTGCESVSTVMLLQYLGIDISVDEFIEKYLDCREFETVDGVLYGADPNEFFAGSPYNPDSFGCYPGVIKKALERLLGDRYTVIDETGAEIKSLLEKYIDNGMPVIFWASIELRETIAGPSWTLFDSGETFEWISNEHCMLLVGYTDDDYIFNDPYNNNGVKFYSRELVEKRYLEQKKRAVSLKKR